MILRTESSDFRGGGSVVEEHLKKFMNFTGVSSVASCGHLVDKRVRGNANATLSSLLGSRVHYQFLRYRTSFYDMTVYRVLSREKPSREGFFYALIKLKRSKERMGIDIHFQAYLMSCQFFREVHQRSQGAMQSSLRFFLDQQLPAVSIA